MTEVLEEDGFRTGTKFYHIGDGFHYYYSSERGNTVYLRCVMRHTLTCPGRACMTLDRVQFDHLQDHNHPPDHLFVQERRMRAAVLARVRNGDVEDPVEILRQEGIRFGRHVASRLPWNSMRMTIHRARNRHNPPLPRTIRELRAAIRLYPHVASSIDGSDNLYGGSTRAVDGSRSIIFVSRRFCTFMQRNVTKIFCDGTFKSRPRRPQCSQVWMIVTIRRNCVIPLVAVLMERQNQEAYLSVLQHLKLLMPGFHPRVIHTDFETAQQNAWRAEYPQARIVGCLWHYVVAVSRKARSLGLFHVITNNNAARTIVRLMCAIPFVPAQMLQQAFLQVVHEARRANVLGVLMELFVYLRAEWIMQNRQWLSVWNEPDRTNNACESANRMLSRAVRVPHPNIWNFLRALARMEDHAITDLHVLSDGRNPGRARRVSTQRSDIRIRNLNRDLQSGDINLGQFLHQASRTFQGVHENVLGIVDSDDDAL